jgi:hypothetical protein
MTSKARAIVLSIAAVLAVVTVLLVRRGGRSEATLATRSLPRSDHPRSPIAICDALIPTLRRMPSTSLGAARLVDLDSAWSGAGKRPACQVAGNIGPIASEFAVADSLEGWLDAAGWGTNTVYSADGPDGHVSSRYRNGATCILSFQWDGPDDADTTATTAASDSMKVELTCAATVPADTTTR